MTKVYHSIKSKYTAFLVLGVLLASLLVGGSGVFLMHKSIIKETTTEMNLNCHMEAEIVNDALDSSEQSVKFMRQYAQRLGVGFEELVSDDDARSAYDEKLEAMYRGIASNTSGNMSYYFRYNPEYFAPDEGFLFSKAHGRATMGGGYIPVEVTDLSQFDPDDEDVEWFFLPVSLGHGTWVTPYWGDNLQMNMISYVEPVFVDRKIIGVVGMDVDFDRVLAEVSRGKMYKSGYAFLVGEDGAVLSSKSLGEKESIGEEEVALFADQLRGYSSRNRLIAYRYNGIDKRMVYYMLNNDMKLVHVADEAEIFAGQNQLIFNELMAALIIALVLAFIGYRFTKRLTRPLKRLSEAAILAGTGDLNVEIPGQDRQDEIGNLARAFHNTVVHIQQYVDYVQNLAYKDALTDVQNKAAYDMSMEQIDVDIRMGRAQFALIMIDLNRLKKINDTYGHEIGNRYIINLCSKITDIFAVETVYRIGGDEFVVLIKGDDYAQREDLLERLRRHLEVDPSQVKNPWDNVSAATGMSEFDPENDGGSDEVFKRADEAMYENKLEMKAGRA